MSVPPKVGIVGGRGIGKQHANWFARLGCEVTAVYGTTEESALAAAATFREQFGFSGRAFHEWERFRQEGDFDVCSVASPAEHHFPNVRDLAADGKHLLCEKPLVWNWSYTPLQIIEEATALVEVAARHGVLLGVNAQYPAAIPGWTKLHCAVLGREPKFRSLLFVLETKGKPRSSHGAAEAWVDLAPHPLAVLDALAPGGVDWTTLRHRDGPHEAVVDFEWVAGDFRLPVHIECRRTTDGSVRRQIGNQDLIADYEGRNIDGEFRARLSADGHEWIGPDFMKICVEQFLAAVRANDDRLLLVNGTAALRQLEALAGVWSHCWR